MSDFVSYFIANLLKEVGYPKKSGRLLRREYVVDTTALDMAAQQSVMLGATLGATEPRIGIQLLADFFPERNWTISTIDNLIEELDPHERVSSGSDSTWTTLAPVSATTLGKQVPWALLGDPGFIIHCVGAFAQSIIWGFTHPTVASQAMSDELAGLDESESLWNFAGLKLSTGLPASLDEYTKILSATGNSI